MFLFTGILLFAMISSYTPLKLKHLTGEVEQVTVNEIKTGRARAARAVQHCRFPHTLHFTFRVQGAKILLNLEKNILLSGGTPVFITNKGRSTLENKNSSNTYAVYQDVLHGSALLVTCQDDYTYRLHGSFHHNGILYQMSHSNVPEPSQNHFVQPTHETSKNFEHDTEIPPDDEEPVGERMLETVVSRQLNDETPIPGGNIVELLFTVDKALYEQFSSIYGSSMANVAIEQYAALLANEIDLHYCSVDMVDPTLSIKIYLAGVIIPAVGTDVSWSIESQSVSNGVTYLDKLLVLPGLKTWLSKESNLPQHDHLMGLSTLDFADLGTNPISTGVEGRAYIGTVCKATNKVSFTEVDATRVALTAAHELGHGLSARHDSSEDCPATDKNIMTSILSTTTSITYSQAQWTFSSCSVESFKSYINGLSTNCLKQHAFTGSQFEELQAKSLPGTVYSLTQQCQMYNGIWSTSCDSTIKEEDCYNGFHCSTSSDLPGGCQTSFYPLYPLAGTPCGAVADNKWCYRGRCVEKAVVATTTSAPTSSTSTTSSTTSSTAFSTSSTSPTTICTTKSTSTTPSTTTSTKTTSTSTTPPTTSSSTSTSTISPTSSSTTTTSPTSSSTSSTSTTSPTTSTSTSTTSTPPTTSSTTSTSTTSSTTSASSSTSTTSTTTTTTSSTSSTTTRSPTTTTSTTVASTTTTIAPCSKKKKCCVKIGKRKKCCRGNKCCKIRQAAETACFKSCCAPVVFTTTTTQEPCYKNKCCKQIEIKGKLKKQCCRRDKCCKKPWGEDTKCCLTCKK